MEMHKSIQLSLLSLLIGTSFASLAGTVDFTGKLEAQTCSVVVNGGTADANITLPTVSATQLNNAGETAGKTGMTFTFTGCTAPGGVAIYFDGGNNVNQDGRLIQQTSDGTGAKNVSLQLYFEGDSKNGGSPSSMGEVVQAGGTTAGDHLRFITIPVDGSSFDEFYAVSYYAESPVTSGIVTSYATYTITYA